MNTNTIPDGKTVSLEEMNRLVAAAPAGPYGFVVSQKVYDELRNQVPAAFESGNSFSGVPIVIDPDMEDGACDVAFTPAGWRARLRQIASRASRKTSREA